jgi:rare lipoprotein A
MGVFNGTVSGPKVFCCFFSKKKVFLSPCAAAYALALAGCHFGQNIPPPPGPPQFTVGPGYQSQGEWRYPRDFSSYDETGLSAVEAIHPAYTADNEVYDADAIAAASPVLQLPAIVTLTNLENGYTMDVRVNDRGPDDPGRIIAVTPKVASLLGFPQDGVTEVEVTLKPTETAAADAALGQGPKLTAAPVAGITAQSLGPPGGAGSGAVQNLTPQDSGDAGAGPAALSGRVTANPPSPGPLYVQIPGFGRPRDANATLDALAGMSAFIVPLSGGDRVLYAIRLGPFTTVADADATLQAVLQRGVTDPEIIVR